MLLLLNLRRQLQTNFLVNNSYSLKKHWMTIEKKLEGFKMKRLQVNASARSYEVSVGGELRFQLNNFIKKDYSKILIVTDDVIVSLYLDDVLNNFSEAKTYIIHTGEASKTLDMYSQLQTYLLNHHFDRNGLIIFLGGGVVGDLAGFVAATYMRGIDYIQIPTTILAHDSSMGGKVAINHELGKNLIGSFYPPQMVLYDVQTLQSLKHEEIRSGYAELVKEALIADETFYRALLDTNLTKIDSFKLVAHLRKGIEIKAKIVEEDEKETGIRKY